MKTLFPSSLLALSLGAALAAAPMTAGADDIDIFTGASAGKAGNPKIMFVLDNTANWSRQSQKWPDGDNQGQSEAQAIAEVVSKLSSDVSVGLFEWIPEAKPIKAGYVRFNVQAMEDEPKANLTGILTKISGKVQDPDEKLNANAQYGQIMHDVWNYFSGSENVTALQNTGSAADGYADKDGYTTTYTQFKSPLKADESCGKAYIIFIGNSDSNGPEPDSKSTSDSGSFTSNSTYLNRANNERDKDGILVPVKQLSLPEFTTENTTVIDRLGPTPACHASKDAAEAASIAGGWVPYAQQCTKDYTNGCAIGSPTQLTTPLACAAGTRTYTVKRTETFSDTITPGSPSQGATYNGTLGTTTGFYASNTDVPANDTGGMSCPATSTVTQPNGATTVTTYSCTYVAGTATTTQTTSTNGPNTTSSCYLGAGTSTGYWDAATNTDRGGLVCPAGYSCSYSGVLSGNAGGCPGNDGKRKMLITQTKKNKAQFTLQQRITPTTTSDIATPRPPLETTLGSTELCYGNPPASTSDFAAQCTGTNVTCSYGNTPTSETYSSCPAGTSAFSVMATNTVLVDTPTGGSSPDTNPFNADEWARLMHDKGIVVPGTTIRPSVTTYTVDVYNAQPNAEQTSLLMSMAKAGGGRYFAAKNKNAIIKALTEIVNEIQATNSTFASTSLPVNATNRSQNVNQVYIGMFRPDAKAAPRWFGNLKRYQLILDGASVQLGDADGKPAVSATTGFVTPCARSFWTFDSGDYWSGKNINPDPKSDCASDFSKYSDNPDGPMVEKGGAAQIVRSGNTGGTTKTYVESRKIYTRKDKALVDFTTDNTGLTAGVVDFIRGQDVNNDKGDGKTTLTRPTIHGDVIHSRPLPVNYGAAGVMIYYGANDGVLHAVNADTGKEVWALTTPEFYDGYKRLIDNAPPVSYPDSDNKVDPGSDKKTYFFDGSSGLYQNAETGDKSKVWIYTTMRRGGRMVYALDVTNPLEPKLKWTAGCESLINDDNCGPLPTSGPMSGDETIKGIGQTWSTPIVAFIKGYSTTTPVVIFGGGYDACEDQDTPSPTCSGKKGGFIYILDGDTGALLYSHATDRAVAADIALGDIDSDGMPDYAFAADTGGNLYRVGFVESPSNRTGLTSDKWTFKKVAFTTGGGRKFLFAPAVLALKDVAYLAIGSGDREHPLRVQYPFEKVQNRFYVYRDLLGSATAGAAIDLDKMADYTTATTCDTPSVTTKGTLNGWFMDLKAYGKGEQTVTAALIVGGAVTFSTNRPIPPDSASCAAPLGQARGYWVSLFNASGAIGVEGNCGGERSSPFLNDGLPPTPVFAQSVIVGDKVVSALLGAIPKGEEQGIKSSIEGRKHKPKITTKRKRTYTITSGD